MRTTTRFFAAAIVLSILIPATNAVAQRRRGLVDVSLSYGERHGAWLSFTAGAGWDNWREDNVAGCNGAVGSYFRCSSLAKPSFAVAFGGTVNPHLRLGGEINAWVNQYNDVATDGTPFTATETLVGGMLTARVFPVRTLGLYAKGGAGISRSGTYVSSGYGGYGGSDAGETGFAFEYGAGYEIKLGRNLFLNPEFSVMNHQSSPGSPGPGDLGTLHERVISFGVGLTFQPGGRR